MAVDPLTGEVDANALLAQAQRASFAPKRSKKKRSYKPRWQQMMAIDPLLQQEDGYTGGSSVSSVSSNSKSDQNSMDFDDYYEQAALDTSIARTASISSGLSNETDEEADSPSEVEDFFNSAVSVDQAIPLPIAYQAQSGPSEDAAAASEPSPSPTKTAPYRPPAPLTAAEEELLMADNSNEITLQEPRYTKDDDDEEEKGATNRPGVAVMTPNEDSNSSSESEETSVAAPSSEYPEDKKECKKAMALHRASMEDYMSTLRALRTTNKRLGWNIQRPFVSHQKCSNYDVIFSIIPEDSESTCTRDGESVSVAAEESKEELFEPEEDELSEADEILSDDDETSTYHDDDEAEELIEDPQPTLELQKRVEVSC